MAGRASPFSTTMNNVLPSRHRTRRRITTPPSAGVPTPDALYPTPEPRNRTGRIKDGVACTWVYDAIYRLTEQQKSGQAATFSYDNAGNLLVKAHEGSNPYSFTYDAANRVVSSVQGASQLTTFTHDNNGNLTGERCDTLGTLLSWVYDNENRCLNEVRPSGANHTYAYAENGLRWSSQMGGSVHVHNSIWVDDDVINDYVDGGLGGRYDVVDGEVLAIKQGASRYAYVPDPLGSVNHLLDTSLNKAATYVYWPYGELQANTGAASNRQFVGALGYDTLTTNRVYVRARDYRPDLGRWQTEDPIGFAGGDWNVYAYVHGGPECRADPTGLFDVKWCYGFCALTLLVGAGVLYNQCVELCSAANDLNDLGIALNKVMKCRGDCTNPRSPADCWTKCRGWGKDFQTNCMVCCGNFQTVEDKCTLYCEYWAGKRIPGGRGGRGRRAGSSGGRRW